MSGVPVMLDTISSGFVSEVPTHLTDQSMFASQDIIGIMALDSSRAENYLRWTDYEIELKRWLLDAGSFEPEEGFEPPTKSCILTTLALARSWKQIGRGAPDRIVPDGEGGVVLERHEFDHFHTVDILPDNSIEFRTYVDGNLESEQFGIVDI